MLYMKKAISLLIISILVCLSAGCSNSAGTASAEPRSSTEVSETVKETQQNTTEETAASEPQTTEKETEKETEPETEAANDDWKQIYTDYLNSVDYDEYGIGELVCVNDDDIPEIILESFSAIPGAKLCWIDNGEVKTFEFGYSNGVLYTARSGLVMSGGMKQGIEIAKVVSFDGSTATEIARNEETKKYSFESTVSFDSKSSDLISKIEEYVV